jgi:hypothetical protein
MGAVGVPFRNEAPGVHAGCIWGQNLEMFKIKLLRMIGPRFESSLEGIESNLSN